MQEIYTIRKISVWIFIIPFAVINICLFITVNYHLLENTIFVVDQIGRSAFTFPYFDGGVSISRTVRTYPTYLLFKPGMVITAFLLIKYWIANNKLFKKIENTNENKYFLFFGVGSALFLIVHSMFLGLNIENDLYKFFRRFVLLGFIIFEIIAQAILVKNFIKSKDKLENYINKKILTLKMILVSLLIVVAILVAPILNSPEYPLFKHGLEWNYFIGVIAFYLLTFMFWRKKEKTSVHTPEGA